MTFRSKLAGLLVLLFLFGVLLLALVFVSQFSGPIHSGTYEGQTIDYTHQRGLIFQTNDLTTKTHERSSAREDWCVPDNRPGLVEQVRDIGEGQRVYIEYYRPLWIHPDTCMGGLKVIEHIEVVNATTS